MRHAIDRRNKSPTHTHTHRLWLPLRNIVCRDAYGSRASRRLLIGHRSLSVGPSLSLSSYSVSSRRTHKTQERAERERERERTMQFMCTHDSLYPDGWILLEEVARLSCMCLPRSTTTSQEKEDGSRRMDDESPTATEKLI